MGVYLDNSATTRVSPEVAQVVYDMMMNKYGNPSSTHSMGLEAELCMKKARASVAKALSVPPETVYFTSGGTEANNMAIFGVVPTTSRGSGRIVATAFEHSSVLAPLRELSRLGFEVVLVSPDENGEITPEAVAKCVNEQTVLVSVMAVNNELGTVQDVHNIAKAVKRISPNAIVHCDAVQAFCKLPLKFGYGYVDIVSVSGHKIHAPKGVGALYVNKHVRLPARQLGGSQENGLRGGTEAVSLICGMGVAAEEGMNDIYKNRSHCTELKELLLAELKTFGDSVVVNSRADALPYIVNFSIPGLRSETLVHYMADKGIYISNGSACAKGAKSHALMAAQLSNELINSAVRISFCGDNTKDDISELIEALRTAMVEIRRR